MTRGALPALPDTAGPPTGTCCWPSTAAPHVAHPTLPALPAARRWPQIEDCYISAAELSRLTGLPQELLLRNELVLLEGLRFDCIVFSPYRAAEGLFEVGIRDVVHLKGGVLSLRDVLASSMRRPPRAVLLWEARQEGSECSSRRLWGAPALCRAASLVQRAAAAGHSRLPARRGCGQRGRRRMHAGGLCD